MKKCLTIFFILFNILFVNSQNLKSKNISKKIRKVEAALLKKNHYYLKLYEDLRNDIDFINLIDLNLESDTLFILETYDFSGLNEDLDIAIWNGKQKLFFTMKNRKNIYKAEKEYNLYPDYMLNLVNNWDIEELNKEANLYSMLGGGTKVAIRIIFTKKAYKIESIVFGDFFNWQRDRKPFEYLPKWLIPFN